jgi:hypothetical protein
VNARNILRVIEEDFISVHAAEKRYEFFDSEQMNEASIDGVIDDLSSTLDSLLDSYQKGNRSSMPKEFRTFMGKSAVHRASKKRGIAAPDSVAFYKNIRYVIPVNFTQLLLPPDGADSG